MNTLKVEAAYLAASETFEDITPAPHYIERVRQDEATSLRALVPVVGLDPWRSGACLVQAADVRRLRFTAIRNRGSPLASVLCGRPAQLHTEGKRPGRRSLAAPPTTMPAAPTSLSHTSLWTMPRTLVWPGANDPYKALKISLKAEIDEEAWESLYRDTSRPFPRPEKGRIAVKVIRSASHARFRAWAMLRSARASSLPDRASFRGLLSGSRRVKRWP
jgi:hypothetical protein